MSLFAVNMYELGGEDHFFVSEDERLWEWLLADNITDKYIPVYLSGSVKLLAPAGHGFYGSRLVEEDPHVATPLKAITSLSDILRNYSFISAQSPDETKASLLISYGFLDYIRPEEFLALGLNDERVAEFTIWK